MKLVRDYIPDIIESAGKTCDWHWVSDQQEHMNYLKLKILEEVDEFIENPCLEEAADILEVLKAFVDLNGFNFDEVNKAAKDKAIKRGSFKAGIVLERVDDDK